MLNPNEAPEGMIAVESDGCNGCIYRGNDGCYEKAVPCTWSGRNDKKSVIFILEDTSKHHPHRDLIIAWANGAEIEYKDQLTEFWYYAESPAWGVTTKYRIKPKVEVIKLKYRVALFKNETGYRAVSYDSKTDYKDAESYPNFVKWITDWIEYEV